jgi:hypothetical protein
MKEVYEQLLGEIERLRGKLTEKELQEIYKEYIYDRLTDEQVLEIIKTKHIKDINLPKGLEIEEVWKLTLLMLDNLKKSSSWQYFSEVHKQPDKEQIDFDSLLKQLLQNKPPSY